MAFDWGALLSTFGGGVQKAGTELADWQQKQKENQLASDKELREKGFTEAEIIKLKSESANLQSEADKREADIKAKKAYYDKYGATPADATSVTSPTPAPATDTPSITAQPDVSGVTPSDISKTVAPTPADKVNADIQALIEKGKGGAATEVAAPAIDPLAQKVGDALKLSNEQGIPFNNIIPSSAVNRNMQDWTKNDQPGGQPLSLDAGGGGVAVPTTTGTTPAGTALQSPLGGGATTGLELGGKTGGVPMPDDQPKSPINYNSKLQTMQNKEDAITMQIADAENAGLPTKDLTVKLAQITRQKNEILGAQELESIKSDAALLEDKTIDGYDLTGYKSRIANITNPLEVKRADDLYKQALAAKDRAWENDLNRKNRLATVQVINPPLAPDNADIIGKELVEKKLSWGQLPRYYRDPNNLSKILLSVQKYDPKANLRQIQIDSNIAQSPSYLNPWMALRTYAGNIETLRDKLNDPEYSQNNITSVNKFINAIQQQFGAKTQAEVGTMTDLLGPEGAQSIGGGAGVVSDTRVKQMMNALKTNNSPEARNAVVDILEEMELNRAASIAQRNKTFGRADFDEFIGDPNKADQAWSKYGNKVKNFRILNQTSGGQGLPQFNSPNDVGFNELPSGSWFLDNNGQKRQKN